MELHRQRVRSGLTRALQRTAAPLGSRMVQVILSALVEQTGCTERRDRAAVSFSSPLARRR
jgi:hypothetical protein